MEHFTNLESVAPQLADAVDEGAELAPRAFALRVSEVVRRFQSLERSARLPLDLTVSQASAIRALGEEGPMRMKRLADYLGRAQSTVTRLVGPLVRRGLVGRREDESDGRATVVYLTSDGLQVVGRLDWADRCLYGSVLGSVSQARRAEIEAAIGLLYHSTRTLAGRAEGRAG